MNRFVVPSTEDMQRLSKQQRQRLSQRLMTALIDLGASRLATDIAVKAAIEKRRELAQVETLKSGLTISVEMIEARELLEEMPVEDAFVTAQRRRDLMVAIR